MPRTQATPRLVNRTIKYGLKYPGGFSNYVNFDSSTFFNSASPWAISTWVNLGSYYGNITSANGLFSFRTDQGVPFIIFMQGDLITSPGIILKFGANSAFASMVPTSPNAVFNKLRRGTHHIVFTFDGVDRTAVSSFALYIDGVSFGLTSSAAPAVTGNTNTFCLLGVSFSGRCTISQTRIWNGGSALSSSDVENLYFNEILPSGATLIREYLTQENSGTTLTDTSGNGVNGTINGSVSWVTSGPFSERTQASSRTQANTRTQVS